ncbi:hypothetical protein KSP39_PZI009843 [Platanthera zijinensis]|uniref:Rab-GAP TBC domain-containing protein n=1 Tax=Platanthera zijinensis TaxID=2320716 RepID=A0AAP0BJ12_9ASPA
MQGVLAGSQGCNLFKSLLIDRTQAHRDRWVRFLRAEMGCANRHGKSARPKGRVLGYELKKKILRKMERRQELQLDIHRGFRAGSQELSRPSEGLPPSLSFQLLPSSSSSHFISNFYPSDHPLDHGITSPVLCYAGEASSSAPKPKCFHTTADPHQLNSGMENKRPIEESEPGPTSPLRQIDRFGFAKQDQNNSIEAKNGPSNEMDRDREDGKIRKWKKMIGVIGSDWKHYIRRKPLVFRRRIRKGIPDRLRGLVWQLISGNGVLRTLGTMADLQFINKAVVILFSLLSVLSLA